MTAYDSIERTAPDEGEPLLMNRRRRSSRTWTLVSAIVVLCLLGFGAIAVHQASVSEEEFSEGFDLAGLSAADETLGRDDFGTFLSSYDKPDVDEAVPDVDEETMPPAELGFWGIIKKHVSRATKHVSSTRHSQCKNAIRQCRVRRGYDCKNRCKARSWWSRTKYSTVCKKLNC
jgi:hypothetical protein